MQYADRPIDSLCSDIASATVTPAGGTAAAIAGAIGTSLSEMSCIHTCNRDDDSATDGDVSALREQLRSHRTTLLTLADEDAALVDELFSDSAADSTSTASERVIDVPLSIAETCLAVLDCSSTVAERGVENTLPDVATGVYLLHSAIQASVFTVRYNLDFCTDATVVGFIEHRTDEIEREAAAIVQRIQSRIEERL